MTKLKGVAILGGLLLAGLTLYSNVAMSGIFPDLTTDVARRLAATCPRGEERPVCRLVAGLVQYLDDDDATFAQKVVFRLEPAVKLGRGQRNCDGCVQAVADIELFLATNGTAQSLEEMITNGCGRFRTPSKIDQCTALADLVPQAIDRMLANVPPLTACSSGRRRPLIYCRGNS